MSEGTEIIDSRYYVAASTAFLCEPLPANFREMEEDELYKFLETYFSEDYQFHEPEQLMNLIEDHAESIHRILNAEK